MDAFWIIFMATLGACVGSFLNVVVYRLPRGQSIVVPPSHCPNCGRGIKWYDNIPLLSWLALRGKCRFCKAPISPRYIIIEAATAAMLAGLYVCYYVLELRQGAGQFTETWPMFASHAALLCCLLACSVVDIESWTVPLEVCWAASLIGVVSSAASPHPWMSPVPPAAGAMALGGVVGLAAALVLVHYGLIRRSFLDVEDKPPIQPAQPGRKKKKKAPKAVAITAKHGVNPRKEVLREVIFLAPAIALAIVARLLVTRVPAVSAGWDWLTTGPAGPHVNGLLAAIFGYLVGGLWIWGIRILGTLGFGKEAMGLGDVHILAAVGAVTGWAVPSIAFFVAPLFGLLWAIYLWLAHDQRELPYGPWLAVATLIIMLFYDPIAEILAPYAETLAILVT